MAKAFDIDLNQIVIFCRLILALSYDVCDCISLFNSGLFSYNLLYLFYTLIQTLSPTMGDTAKSKVSFLPFRYL